MKKKKAKFLTLKQERKNIEHLFSTSVKKHLISDRKVGFFFSGGTDSLSILSKAKSYIKNLELFTYNFLSNNGSFYGEFEKAQRIAADLNLRIDTIIAYDYSNKPLFSSRILKNLKKLNSIKIDLDISTYKDFITIDMFSEILDKLIIKKMTGIFNLSSGIPIKVHEVADSILKGYGKGKIIYKKKLKKNESFLLDNSKLKKKIKFNISKKHILNYCKNLGKKLTNA